MKIQIEIGIGIELGNGIIREWDMINWTSIVYSLAMGAMGLREGSGTKEFSSSRT